MPREWLGLARNPEAQEEAEENYRDHPEDHDEPLAEGEPWDVADLAEMQYGREARTW